MLWAAVEDDDEEEEDEEEAEYNFGAWPLIIMKCKHIFTYEAIIHMNTALGACRETRDVLRDSEGQ